MLHPLAYQIRVIVLCEALVHQDILPLEGAVVPQHLQHITLLRLRRGAGGVEQPRESDIGHI